MPRSLNRSLTRRLNRPRNCYATTMLGGARRPRSGDGFGEIFQIFREYFCVRDRMAEADPHLFGPEAPAYYRETVAEHKWAVTVDAALDRVYGPPEPGTVRSSDEIWSQAYPNFQSASEKEKWVKNWSRFRKQK